MSRRDSEDNPSTKSGGAPPPRRDAAADVDHARLAQLVAANYTPPAPPLTPTQRDARPAATPSPSQTAAPPPRPPAGFDATLGHIPAKDERLFESAPVMAAAPPPPPRHVYAAQQGYAAAPMAAPRARKSPLACALLAALVVLLLAGGGALFGWLMFRRSAPLQSMNTNAAPPRKNTESVIASAPPEQVFVAGGTFRMGRDDAGEALLHESPAHAVTLSPFWIDRTEVTNAEYAEFVRATGHAAPSDGGEGDKETAYWKPWSGTSPPAGQELWPVRNVTFDDARAFAAWRSRRDGGAYRLPTEEEWEYAARSGGAHKLYPWGEEFTDDRAVLDAALPQAVGSRAGGASREGVLDLIGNVWEWTASNASRYPGSRDAAAMDSSLKVARGGSYQSRGRGGAAVTATTRTFIKPETRHPTLGFRLVREARTR